MMNIGEEIKFTLRSWQLSDAESLAKHANNFKIARFLTNMFPNPYNRQDAINFINAVKEDDPVKIFAIEVNGEAVGSIGLTPQHDIHCKNAELGYWLSEDYWGKGIMPAAIRAMVEYGFCTFDIERIFARPFGTNPQSRRVLEKAGFQLEATFPKALFKNGEYIDELYYGIRR